MERSFAQEVKKLQLGRGQVLRGEGILAITKALLQAGVSYVGGYPGAPVSHLLDVMALPSVSLGVIPFHHGGRRMWTLEGFNIFDSTQVSVELLSAAVSVCVPAFASVAEKVPWPFVSGESGGSTTPVEVSLLVKCTVPL